MKFKGPNKAAYKIGSKLVQFTSNGTLITEDKDIIDVLKTIKGVEVIGGKEPKVETKKVEVETKDEIVEEDGRMSLEEASAEYEEIFGKKVPNNKKNDLERILKKLD